MRASQVANPIPLAPPVMTIVLSLSSMGFLPGTTCPVGGPARADG